MYCVPWQSHLDELPDLHLVPGACDHMTVINKDQWFYFSRWSTNVAMLRDNLDKLDWNELSGNPAAMPLLLEHQDRIHWPRLSGNTAAVDLLRANPHRIQWARLSVNRGAVSLLEENVSQICWQCMVRNQNGSSIFQRFPDRVIPSSNPAGIDWMLANPRYIYWPELYKNPRRAEMLVHFPHRIDWKVLATDEEAFPILSTNPIAMTMLDAEGSATWNALSKNAAAMDVLLANQDRIHWVNFCLNTAAIPFLSTHLDKVDWETLCMNPAAIPLLLAYPDNIHWRMLSGNPGAMTLLATNHDKIHWDMMATNPGIFAYHYEGMRRPWTVKHLAAWLGHPSRLHLMEEVREVYTEDELLELQQSTPKRRRMFACD